MARRLSLFLSLASTVAFASTRTAGAAQVESIPVSGKVQWIYSYEDGQKLARETGKPMFVVFRCER